MRTTETLAFVGVKMPASQKRRLFALARKRHTSASELIRQALTDLAAKVA